MKTAGGFSLAIGKKKMGKSNKVEKAPKDAKITPLSWSLMEQTLSRKFERNHPQFVERLIDAMHLLDKDFCRRLQIEWVETAGLCERSKKDLLYAIYISL